MDSTSAKKRKERGFTLLEILIGIAIIGVICSIAIPQYQDYIARKQLSEAGQLIEKLTPAYNQIYQENPGHCPTSSDQHVQAVQLNNAQLQGQFVQSVTFAGQFNVQASAGCTAIVVFQLDDIAAPIAGKKLQFMAYAYNNNLKFICLRNGATTISDRLLPIDCIISTLTH